VEILLSQVVKQCVKLATSDRFTRETRVACFCLTLSVVLTMLLQEFCQMLTSDTKLFQNFYKVSY